MKIADEIQSIRISIKKWTRLEMARFIGVTENTIYNWETGRYEPSASQMDKIRLIKKD
jgi:DNA-binding XRE family transcriptional regulator